MTARAAPHVAEILAGYAARDSRDARAALAAERAASRARSISACAPRASATWRFIDHDDRLEPDAAWQLIRAARETDADLLYSDEAQTAENIDAITELRLRPAFSHDYYLSHPYFVHLVCARTDIARRIGGWDESLAISADVDFVLRMIEHRKRGDACAGRAVSLAHAWRQHRT